MNRKEATNKYVAWGFLALIILGGIVAMAVVTPRDAGWTHYLRDNRIDWFKDWMADSMFEGEMFGGGDIMVIFLIVSSVLYLLAWITYLPNQKVRDKLAFLIHFVERRPRLKKTLDAWRPQLGFIITSSLCTSIYLIHTTKWLVGRARPKAVWEKGYAFSEWYDFGSHFVAEGIFRGSFPSGHTAAMFTVMTLAYVLCFDSRKVWPRMLGVVIGVYALGSAILMLIARSMSQAHWVTDSTFAIFGSWALMHSIYFFLLQIPYQRAYYREHQHPLKLPIFYELQLLFLLFMVCIGFMAVVIGLRAVYIQNCPWLIVISPIGATLMVVFLWLLRKREFFHHEMGSDS